MSQEEKVQMYLGMNPSQFGILMSLTSLSRQMQSLVEGQDMFDLMTHLIKEHDGKTDAQTLEWVRHQRNHLLNISHAVLVSQNMLAQIDDALITSLIEKNTSAIAETVENIQENA